MDINTVKHLRGLHKSENILLFTDNAKLHTNTETTKIIWDDTEGVVHSIGTNTNYYKSKKLPIQVESFDYVEIQYIGSAMSLDEFETLLKGFVTKTLITQADADKLLAKYRELYNK